MDFSTAGTTKVSYIKLSMISFMSEEPGWSLVYRKHKGNRLYSTTFSFAVVVGGRNFKGLSYSLLIIDKKKIKVESTTLVCQTLN